MRPDLLSNVWSLPGARRFVHQAAHDLNRGISLYALFPPTVDLDGFQQQLFHCLERDYSLIVHILDLSSYHNQSPFEFLHSVLSLEAEYFYLEQMVEDSMLPNVILIRLPDTLKSLQAGEWIQTVERWAEGCRSTGAEHSICLFASANLVKDLKLPRQDVRLDFKVWAGIPSILETRLLCRICDDTINAETQWREYMLASVAANDLWLGEELWDLVYKPPSEIILFLKECASKRGWSLDTEQQLKDWHPKSPGLNLRFIPNENGFGLLGGGLTVYTPEYGEEINSALLALLGKENEVYHRIWRAQASLILPLIDDVRRRICEDLTVEKGDGWAMIDNEKHTYPLELGKLKYYFETLDTKDRQKNRWGGCVFQAWQMRNELAHYKPVPYTWFSEFWRVYNRVRSIGYKMV